MLNRYMCVNRNDPTALSAADSPKNSSIIVFDCTRADDIDLVVCLGGDGTLLKIGSMFQRVVPPVIAFCLGTLGFLAPFSFTSFESVLKHAIEGSPNCLMRMRLCCQVVRSVPQEKSVASSPDDPSSSISVSRSISPDTEYHFLNELVIDRGLSPSSCDLVVKVNGKMVTHFEGDGLIVSTPTGSTAYSMATGASMLHPCVPAFLLTPINSLTLSSRAIVLPMSMQLEISINPAARCKVAHFSFDGRSRECNMINKGDAILVSGSPYPMPCISGSDQQVDWFCGLNHLLNWNTRNKRADLHDCLDCSDMATA
ncbi:NAD kinase [Paragonimus heterotremus]|uniref:NAD(+) kinase n=2 Tax=Paragonimus TaxID=34503 RepID=A0A8J4SNE0_9TREM|nr:NAD kinase [Paragonimus heterotremus]